VTYPVNSPALSYWVTTEKRLSPQGSDLVPFSGRVYDHHLDNWRYETKQKNAGWWFQPLWKILVNCQWEGLSHISWKNNVPNHQPDWVRLIGHWDITNRLMGIFDVCFACSEALTDVGAVTKRYGQPKGKPKENNLHVVSCGLSIHIVLEDTHICWCFFAYHVMYIYI